MRALIERKPTPEEPEEEPLREDIAGLFRSTHDTPMPESVRARAAALAPGAAALAQVGEGRLEPGARLGPYEVVSLLGTGGQASVYRARDTRDGGEVALKVPRREVASRLLREAHILERLSDPGIVALRGLHEEGNRPFLALELCTGGSLADKIRAAKKPLPLSFVWNVATETLRALEVAHGTGVIHRDLKPANILFDDEGRVKIADFGIGSLALAGAKAPLSSTVAPTAAPLGATVAGAGTPHYMAPEQEDPRRKVDGRADLYALGKVLYEAITGRSPRTMQPLARVRHEAAAWDEVIFRLCDDRVEARPADAPEALALLLDDRVAPMVKPGPPTKKSRPAVKPRSKSEPERSRPRAGSWVPRGWNRVVGFVEVVLGIGGFVFLARSLLALKGGEAVGSEVMASLIGGSVLLATGVSHLLSDDEAEAKDGTREP